MFKKITVSVLALALVTLLSVDVKGQTGSLLGGNIFNSAITGTAIGAATMGITNNSDFTPLRVGLGSGILFGAGMALYDVTTLPSGQQFYISGLINNGNNTSIILLLDTMYGAAGGALIGSAVMLIANKPIVDGLQYGSSIGTFAGFGLGLLDIFIFSERNENYISNSMSERHSLIQFSDSNLNIGLIQPRLYSFNEFSDNSLSVEFTPGLQLLSINKSF